MNAALRGLAAVASVALIPALLSPAASGGGGSPDQLVAAWTELGPAGVLSARAVVAVAPCPALRLSSVTGSANLQMTVRAPANPPAFTDTVCEATIPAGATAASVAGHSLPLRHKEIRRIAFLGDTGCKIKGSKAQACNSPAAWPFGSIAASIAAERPDLVVHLGDVHYRFEPCPVGMPPPGCSGSPYGVNSPTLRADWFTPAAPLFATAPLIMARGNHENCDDGDDWIGWFRYFAFGPVPSSCQMFTAPYTVQLTSHQQLIVLDDSSAKDTPTPSLVREYRAELAEVVRLATRPTWLVSHVPLWQVKRGNAGEGGVATLEQATRELPRPLPPDLHLVISGDVHQFEYLGFGGQHASQLILGDGGVLMSKAVKGGFSGRSVDGAKVLEGRADAVFGYGVITLPKKQHSPGTPVPVSIMHVNGSPWLACSLARSRLDCKKARRRESLLIDLQQLGDLSHSQKLILGW